MNHHAKRVPPALACLVLLCIPAVAHAELVTFHVQVPWCTPAGQPVMLRSNRESAQVYRHDALARVDATHYAGTFDVATPRAAFNYKYSSGVCDPTACPGIEKDIHFATGTGELPDRTLAAGVASVDDVVFIWRNTLGWFDPNGTFLAARTPAEQVAFCAPYLSISSTSGAITLSHDSLAGEDILVEYGLTESYGSTASVSGSIRNHVVLAPLLPGETYHYRVTEGGRVGLDQTFRAPPLPTQSFRVGFMGDTQFYGPDDGARMTGVVNQLLAFQPQLMISPGDMVASNTNATGMWMDPEMGRWSQFFAVAQPLMSTAPLMVAMGNHEEDAPYWWDAFEFPKPDAPRLDHYWFKYGNTHFTFLYTGVTSGYDLEGILDSQTAWLAQTLTAANLDPEVRWKVVVLHRAPFSQGANHTTDIYNFYGNSTPMRPSWGSLWESHGVDLVLGGHNHNFTEAFNAGVHYLISCGGAPVHPLRSPTLPTTLYAESTCTATMLEVTGKTFRVNAVRPDGSAIPQASLALCRQAVDCDELNNPCPGQVEWACAQKRCQSTCVSISSSSSSGVFQSSTSAGNTSTSQGATSNSAASSSSSALASSGTASSSTSNISVGTSSSAASSVLTSSSSGAGSTSLNPSSGVALSSSSSYVLSSGGSSASLSGPGTSSGTPPASSSTSTGGAGDRTFPSGCACRTGDASGAWSFLLGLWILARGRRRPGYRPAPSP